MKYFIYCRKSSEGESKQAQSLSTQQRILTELTSRLDLEIADIFKESKSAKDPQNRPLFDQMLDRIRQGEAEGILVVHTDRLARNLVEAGIITKLFEHGLLKEIKTPSNTYDSAQAMLYLGFDFVFAAHYSRKLSIKVKEGNKSKLLKGEYPSYAPIGYVNIRPGKGIEPDPIRAPFIKQAFELYSTGEYSMKTLANELEKRGFRSRRGKKKSASSIHRLLNNPEYYGVIRRKEKLYPGSHEPLITKSMFDHVQELIDGRSPTAKRKHDYT